MRRIAPRPELFALPGHLCVTATEAAQLLNLHRRTLQRWFTAGVGPKPLDSTKYHWNVRWYPVHHLREWLGGFPEALDGPYFADTYRPLAPVGPLSRKGVRRRSSSTYFKMRLWRLELGIKAANLGIEMSHHYENDRRSNPA